MDELRVEAPRKRNRAKRYPEAVALTLVQGAKARMDAVLEGHEDRLDLIRGAIDREVARREKSARRTTSGS